MSHGTCQITHILLAKLVLWEAGEGDYAGGGNHYGRRRSSSSDEERYEMIDVHDETLTARN